MFLWKERTGSIEIYRIIDIITENVSNQGFFVVITNYPYCVATSVRTFGDGSLNGSIV